MTLSTYKKTSTFPRDELYGITSQMRRASVSIASNIAEGCGRKGEGEFGYFLQIAVGSASELEYQLLLVRDLKFLPDTDYIQMNNQVNEVKRMLISLIGKLDQTKRNP